MKDICENSRRELLFAYLDIRTEKERNLKVRAYAELILKSIYSNNEQRWIDIDDIKKMIEKFSDISKIPNKSILKSLDFLTNEINYLDYSNEGEKWKIKTAKLKQIEENIDENKKNIDIILDYFLSSEMDEDKVRDWFLYICEKIFMKEEDEFLKAIANKNSGNIKDFKIDEELRKSIAEYGLEDFENNLVNSFNDFIKNLSNDDSKFLLLLSQNVLTSKIVAIDLDVDTLFSDFLKDCKIVIDTNIFITQILNEEKLDDLFSTLCDMGAEFYFINKTREEFEYVISAKKDGMMSVAEKGILAGIRFDDDFYDAASDYGCQNNKDIERFFDNNFYPFPPNIGGVEIKELKKSGLDEIEDKVTEEVESSSSTRCANLLIHKSKNTLIHDLTLNDITVKSRKEKEKVIILTKDGSMQEYSINNMKKRDEFSHWMHLKAMLSIVSAGMPYKEGFSKIFKNMLKDSCCMQGREGFNLEDVKHLMNSSKEIKIEECSKINECVEVVRKHRLMGNDGDSEELKRVLDDIIMQEQLPELEKIKNKLEEEKDDKKREIKKRDGILVSKELGKINLKINFKFVGLVVLYLVIAFLLSVLAYKIAKEIWINNNTDWIVIFFTIVIPLESLACVILYKIHWPEFQKQKKNALLMATEAVNKLLSK